MKYHISSFNDVKYVVFCTISSTLLNSALGKGKAATNVDAKSEKSNVFKCRTIDGLEKAFAKENLFKDRKDLGNARKRYVSNAGGNR